MWIRATHEYSKRKIEQGQNASVTYYEQRWPTTSYTSQQRATMTLGDDDNVCDDNWWRSQATMSNREYSGEWMESHRWKKKMGFVSEPKLENPNLVSHKSDFVLH